ncbi:unnamed protein product [Cyclocybe aegerita]|uniref:Uncharacterized protein n=1 Tax=Cyclocybe aegerita TaxID=1973307 RepID=A0A8S0WSW9_CYCAE|nr:unnamed protein product [Cyclocybe aegerita]
MATDVVRRPSGAELYRLLPSFFYAGGRGEITQKATRSVNQLPLHSLTNWFIGSLSSEMLLEERTNLDCNLPPIRSSWTLVLPALDRITRRQTRNVPPNQLESTKIATKASICRRGTWANHDYTSVL